MIICEVWCSPKRQEIYSKNFIGLATTDFIEIDELKLEYITEYGDFWYDVFGEEYSDIGGLWKVVIECSVRFENYYYDWEGVPGTRVIIESDILFKDRCASFDELRFQWEGLKEVMK